MDLFREQLVQLRALQLAHVAESLFVLSAVLSQRRRLGLYLTLQPGVDLDRDHNPENDACTDGHFHELRARLRRAALHDVTFKKNPSSVHSVAFPSWSEFSGRVEVADEQQLVFVEVVET